VPGLSCTVGARIRNHRENIDECELEVVEYVIFREAWIELRYESDAAQREKYLKSAWGKRYIKSRLRHYLTG
jgi:hypothetical protein